MARHSDRISAQKTSSNSRDAIVEAGVQKTIEALEHKGIDGAYTNEPLLDIIRQHLELVRQEAAKGIPAWKSSKCHDNVQPFQQKLVDMGLGGISPQIHSSTAQGTQLVIERTEATRGVQL
jgi:hypothetical protein